MIARTLIWQASHPRRDSASAASSQQRIPVRRWLRHVRAGSSAFAPGVAGNMVLLP
jgi:hypothetical protein